MRPVALGFPPSDPRSEREWIIRSIREIENASKVGGDSVADDYTISGSFVETRTLDLTTPNAANIAAVLATLLSDMKKRGSRRKRTD